MSIVLSLSHPDGTAPEDVHVHFDHLNLLFDSSLEKETNQCHLCAGNGAALVDGEGSAGIGLCKPVLLLGIVDVSHSIPARPAAPC